MKRDLLIVNNYSNQDIAYLRCAFVMSELSKAIRKKVGSILVSYDNTVPTIISDGVNGTDPGNSNLCEDPNTGLTLDSVIHAEDNCIRKVENRDVSFLKGTLYVTFQPCVNCCKRICEFNKNNDNKQITRVVYCFPYKDTSGLDLLSSSGIEIVQIPMNAHLQWELNLKSELKYDLTGVYRSLGHSEEDINCIVKLQHCQNYDLL